MKKKANVRMITEGGMMIALSVLLSYIKIYTLPNGGSITAGSMIPLILFAIRWGVGPGIAVGACYGIIDFILKPYFYHPLQFLLDYPIAFGMLGLAGLGYFNNKNDGYARLSLGVALGIAGRAMSHVLSGVIFFAEYAGDQNVWIYSIVYNLSYLLPELLISLLVLVLVWRPMKASIVR
ncbi:MAG TPA: energy-coupled thiamine transporter ThiT [Tissierellaceae bacterium]|nr:energy-coupled thiamine transporter ThiT [Tissierellaceae bacterium]